MYLYNFLDVNSFWVNSIWERRDFADDVAGGLFEKFICPVLTESGARRRKDDVHKTVAMAL